MKFTRHGLRSLRGQLTLLGVMFLGGLALAVGAVCLRPLFERFVGETYRAPPEDLAVSLRAVAEGTAGGPDRRKLNDVGADVLYEAWMRVEQLDRDGRLARHLFSTHGELILERARRTLVVGTVAQRLRVLELLGWMDAQELAPSANRLGRYTLERAERRHENELAGRARLLLRKLPG